MKKYSPSKLIALFRKFGGLRLVWAYARLGVLGAAVKAFARGVVRRMRADEIFCLYEPKIVEALRTKYGPLMRERLSKYEAEEVSRVRSDIVWFCWLQGIEAAPAIVKACYKSLIERLQGKEIRLIDERNRRDYAQLPEFIERRYEKGQIPPAMFADLLRLELLIKHGGSWIDATVFCSSADYPREYLDAELFFFQYSREGAPYAGISNWFISSCSNNPLLMTLRDMLYAYWKDFDCVVEYFIFHRFFDMIAGARPEVIARMPYAFSPQSHLLQRHWHEPFDQARWDKLTSRVSFHKLAHQLDSELESDKGNYYNYILSSTGKL